MRRSDARHQESTKLKQDDKGYMKLAGCTWRKESESGARGTQLGTESPHPNHRDSQGGKKVSEDVESYSEGQN